LGIPLKEGIGGERRPKDRVTFQITLMFKKEFTTDLLDPRCFRWASTLGKIFHILCGPSSYPYGVLILGKLDF
jgi:hypothetical protein